MFRTLASLILTFAPISFATTVTYDFNITWVHANPDGRHVRPVIGINGQWPLPQVTVTVGDRLIINLMNQLGNQSTSLHFHGLYMAGSNHMDGPIGVTQCGIAPGEAFRYNFTIDQPGTYWYHSHAPGQYPDGLRGPMIVHDPDSPYKGQYDEEKILTLSDWYHDEMPNLLKNFISVTNPTGAEPVPDAALMNDTQNLTTLVEPGKTYLFRIINMGAFAGQYFWFEGHTMQIVEVDGIYTRPAEANMIYLTAAQRYSVLVTAKNDTATNFAFVGSMDEDLFDKVPDTLNPNVTGYLIYNGKTDDPPTPALLETFDPFDDFGLVPQDAMPLLPEPDYTVPLDVKMDNLGDGASYAFFNNITYVLPEVPTLYSALSTGATASNASIYGPNTNAFILEKGQVVDIILNNMDVGKHPFHLHGHAFQALVRSSDDAGVYVANETFPAVPMRRDTFMVRPNGNIVLRFKADNPDKFHPSFHPKTNSHKRIWLFHCHIEWHVATGLVATLIESPPAIQNLYFAPASTLSDRDPTTADSLIPPDHLAACHKQGIPTTGNVVGNTVDLFDLRGAPTSVPPLPAGFTPRGIVALVFSIVTGLLGVAVIAWYGTQEIGAKHKEEEGKAADGDRRKESGSARSEVTVDAEGEK